MESDSIENEELSWRVLDLPINATITRPADRDLHPAVVFVSGSGPTDRDWCSPLLRGKNGSAKLLAEKLANEGFVTLRYDKLGSGSKVREYLPKFAGKVSMQTHVDQLAGAVQTIISENNVDRENLFVLTNSEGAIHAVNYQLQAKDNRFKGLVLTGAPGRTVGEVARNQILDQLNQLHNAKGATGFLIRLISKIKPLPDTETTMKYYDKAVLEFLEGGTMNTDPSLLKGIRKLLLGLAKPANQPFSRELWAYNLKDHITKIDEPILVLIGKKDIQVDWMIDGNALENTTAQKSSVTLVYPENANHLLKHEERPREKLDARYVGSHYNDAKAQLDQEAVDVITTWLKKTGDEKGISGTHSKVSWAANSQTR